MESIRLEKVLPLVFRGMEKNTRISESEIWLEETVELRRGCRVCLQAESGGGKSSLLSFIFGNRKDFYGDIFFDDRNVRDLTDREWAETRRRHIALLPQEMRLFPELTVMENIEIKNSLTGYKSSAEIEEMLARLGIAEKSNTPCRLLSVGQQQRVAIVRTLCQPFDFIFLDEPVSHLDMANNRVVAEMVVACAEAQNAGIVSTSVGNPLLLPSATLVNL